MENQALVTRHEPVAVDEQIRRCVILLAEKWEGREYEFDIELPHMQIERDPDLLQQIWLNLIDNAMKYFFDAFYQCEESHKKDGNGLGLSIVKGILELLNGRIECQSAVGQGTQMTVIIQENVDK